MRHPSGLLRLAAAVILTAAAGVALPVPAATAAACSSAAGVTVVVDFHELGGGVQQVCDAGSGQSAAARFVDAGFDLDRVQRQPGFVCRVDGLPADDPCVNTPPADAYWSLWWSNGESGTWTFASQGIDSLKVPDGGAVALSWKGSSESSPPGAAPPKQQTAPSASPVPVDSAVAALLGGRVVDLGLPGGPAETGGSSASTSGTPSPSASTPTESASSATSQQRAQRAAKRKRSVEGSAAPSADASAGPDARPAAAPDPAPPADGLPVWVAPVGIGALFAAAAATAVVRRRRGPGHA